MIREAVASVGGGSPNISVTVNVNGNVSKDVDIKKAVAQGIDEYWRTHVMARRA